MASRVAGSTGLIDTRVYIEAVPLDVVEAHPMSIISMLLRGDEIVPPSMLGGRVKGR